MTKEEFLNKVNELKLTPELAWNEFEIYDKNDYHFTPEQQAELDKLEAYYESLPYVENGRWSDEHRDAYCAIKDKKIEFSIARFSELGPIEEVYREGGGEGEGEHVEIVLYFENFGYYLAGYASYYSYHGIDYWQDWVFVKPQERMITEYVADK